MAEIELVRAELAVLVHLVEEVERTARFKLRPDREWLAESSSTRALILRSPARELGRYVGAIGLWISDRHLPVSPAHRVAGRNLFPRLLRRILWESAEIEPALVPGLLDTARWLLTRDLLAAESLVRFLADHHAKAVSAEPEAVTRLVQVLEGLNLPANRTKPIRNALMPFAQSLLWPLSLFSEAGVEAALAPVKKKEKAPELDFEALRTLFERFAADLSESHSRIEGGANGPLSNAITRLARWDGAASVNVLERLGMQFSRKISGHGAVSVKGYTTVLDGLVEIGSTEAANSLVRLSERAHTPTLRTAAAKRLEGMAVKHGTSPDALQDAAVPTFEIGTEGVHRVNKNFGVGPTPLGSARIASLEVSESWPPLTEKPKLSSAAKQSKEYKDAAALQKEMQRALLKQRRRIEDWLLIRRQFTFAELEANVLWHPLIGPMARALIWNFRGVPAMLREGVFHDGAGRSMQVPADTECILWHPIDSGVSAIEVWRDYLFELELIQPIKQAFREVYLLTDAERATRLYSNRFAAHILKQGQFAALANERGWSYQPAVYADVIPLAKKAIPGFDLVAEFSVEGVFVDTGTLILEHVSSDSLRFTRNKEPVPLEQVPPHIFCEICRDCDLFVSVASAGNDPNWVDQQVRYGNWGQQIETSIFGELAPSAESRRAVLERLLPRLAIGRASHIEGRWLIVRGTRKTYKIHLGSGNILMSPNDQYLCIVPKSAAETNIYLPFEGDRMLSIILSKAEMLMRDDKITDPTILSQL